MKRPIFGFAFLLVFSFSLFAHASDSDYGRIVGDRKYFGENHTVHTFGRDYIVRNPRTTLSQPATPPLVKMDSTQQECEVWTEDQRIGFFELTPYSPRIAVFGDTIHVVWEQWWEVFYKRSVDGGMTWGDSVPLSLIDTYESFMQDIAVEYNNVYVVWAKLSSGQDQGIYFRKSTDAGANWGSISPIALAGPDYYGFSRPTIVAKDSLVFIAYQKYIDKHHCVRFKKSTNWGNTWSQEIHVSDLSVSGHWAKMVPNLAGLYITHEDGFKIWCNKSTDWGDTWSDDIFISDTDSSLAQWPSIGADDNGGVYITWFDYKYSPYPWTGDIFLRRSIDNGESWEPIISLTDNHLGVESDVCADRSSVHVAWHDERHNIGDGNTEIYHRRSTNLGFGWEEEDRLTDALCQSHDPRITRDRSKLYMVWVDDRNDPEPQSVYFKKGYWYIPGDVNRDRIVDIGDIVFLINYLFMSGTSPDIFESGDVNSDGQIDIGDVVCLINYLFIGGPEPVGC